MRLIDADELLEILAQNCVFFGDDNEKLSWDIIEDSINEATTIEAEPVVRCKHCKYYDSTFLCPVCYRIEDNVEPDDYCSYGEK